MPTLRELDAHLLQWQPETTTERDGHGMWVFRDEQGEPELWSPYGPTRDVFVPVATLQEAHGIRFLCPKNFAKNGGAAGTHSTYVWFASSPVPGHLGRNKKGQTVRWTVMPGSTGIDDLSLTPSIQEQDEGACGWHGFVGSNGVPRGSAA